MQQQVDADNSLYNTANSSIAINLSNQKECVTECLSTPADQQRPKINV